AHVLQLRAGRGSEFTVGVSAQPQILGSVLTPLLDLLGVTTEHSINSAQRLLCLASEPVQLLADAYRASHNSERRFDRPLIPLLERFLPCGQLFLSLGGSARQFGTVAPKLNLYNALASHAQSPAVNRSIISSAAASHSRSIFPWFFSTVAKNHAPLRPWCGRWDSRYRFEPNSLPNSSFYAGAPSRPTLREPPACTSGTRSRRVVIVGASNRACCETSTTAAPLAAVAITPAIFCAASRSSALASFGRRRNAARVSRKPSISRPTTRSRRAMPSPLPLRVP